MESVTPCQVSINKNDVFLHGDPHSIKDKLQENGPGSVTTVGINVTLAPMEAMQSEVEARETEPPDLPEKENSFTITNSNNLVSESSLTSEQLAHLKQCRNRAYSIVNKKKRMHLNASLPQHLQKEWLTLYPDSSLSGKRLLEIFETHSINSVINDLPKKSNRGRKRKVHLPEAVPQPIPPPVKKTKSSPSEFEVNNGMVEVISEASHEDRQWTTAMLCNLMFCNRQAEIKKTDLETEWQLLYPNSVLSARNLKSRLTVYQRTHSEKSAPKKPTKEKIILKIKAMSKPPIVPILQPLTPNQVTTEEPRIPPIKLSKSPIKLSKPEPELPITPQHESPEPAVFAEADDVIEWSEKMVSDMFDTLDAAREELNSTDNDIVSTRWHQLWSEKNPTSSNVQADDLYNRYTDHVKKASQLLSPVRNSLSPITKCEDSPSPTPPEVIEAEEAVEAELEAEVEPEPVKPPIVGFQWTQDLFEELQREQKYVEDKLRCIQDDYFFELLQERWSDNHPECRDGPEELRHVLQTFTSSKLKEEMEVTENPNLDHVKQESDDLDTEVIEAETKETFVKSELNPNEVVKTEFTPYECKEEPVETDELPRSKWVCDNHYIHVFYDDQDKNIECVLTDQLLQIRNALVLKFPGQDLFKSGKKPPGFAKMLLSEWLRHYPDSQENTKTISMKIGRYDRAPQMLMQDTKSASGRINWSPAMIETIRATRERAVERFSSEGAGMAGSMSRYWREEWEMAYPDLNIDWKQVVSRYHYHFGAERRDSSDSPSETMSSAIPSSRVMRGSQESEVEDAGAREDIRGFRQWTSAMTEDLVIMRNILLREDPNADPSSKAFSKQLMALFKEKHPNCMESERSLLSKLRESNNLTTSKEAPVKSRPKAVKVETPKKNPAVDLMSDIEGFTDWNLGMVRDFISCMDRARRKYTEMKENDPQMKLVPLLLVEWKAMYPDTGETVRSFLVRIRSLKTNKELIKAKLGEHDLLPRMSTDETPSQASNEPRGEDDEEEMTQEEAIRRLGKFVWDSNTMMPVIISTRAKAIAKQKKEMTQGKRISYAKIWIKEFKKVYPNCPYTANNLSVHYWYWTSRQENNSNDKTMMLKKAAAKEVEVEEEVEDMVEEAPQWSEWSEEDHEDLKRIAEKVDRMLKADGADKQLKFPKLLHSVWLNLHPESVESETSLMTIYKAFISQQQRVAAEVKVDFSNNTPASGTLSKDIWTPKHNKMLRAIVESLKVSDNYTRGNLVKEWCRHFPRLPWDILSSRIDDCGYSQPTHYVLIKDKASEAPKKAPKALEKRSTPETDPSPAGLNARGQMRWTQQAVTDLLECHKLGLKSKNSKPDKKLADLVHQKFKQRHPYCPIAPNVLLTKCYILRSELKSGKLVLNDDHEDTGEKYRGESGLRTWTRQMLDELVASRKRAIGRKKSVGGGVNFGKLLGDLWLEEFRNVYPDYKSSKKNLFRKYKWWRQRRAEMEKDVTKMMPKVELDEEGVLFSELKKSLSENSVTLPPFVSSKVIMLAQQWVENTQAREEAREVDPDNEIVSSGQGSGMITLPGGAVLVAKQGAGDQARLERGAEPPDVSITLSGVQTSDNGVSITLCNNTSSTVVTPVPAAAPEGSDAPAPGVPPDLLSILDSMELPLALLPTLLAVYRDVRDTHKILCVQGYCVSWSTLLTARLRSAWPGTSLTTQSMDSLVTKTLTAAGHAQITCKTVQRPGPVIPAAKISLELLTRIQDHVDSFDRHPLASWKAWQGNDEIPLSSRQFVSLGQFLCPPSDTYNWDDLMWQADLCEVWSGLSSVVDKENNNDSSNKTTKRQYRRVNDKREDDNVSFNKIGRWLQRVNNIGSVKKIDKRRPRLVTNNLRLFWSDEKIEILKQSNLVAFDKWRFGKNRKYTNLKNLIVDEFKSRIASGPSNLSSGQILGKLSQIQRVGRSRLAIAESREWNRYVNEYNEFLENEADIETEEYVDSVAEKVVKREFLDGEVDYNIDANVLDYIREKEGGKKSAAPVWGSSSLYFLLKARTLALARRDKWEKWAVAKHGSLQVAVSNPRVKVPKVEELLMEEWSQLRPNMSGISAWTLNSYLKKFDGVKRTLIEDQEEARRLRELRAAPPVRMNCHPNTDIPIYKLSQLETYPKLPANVKQLIGSRQRALTSQPASSIRYLHLWAEQWLQETGERTEGWVLQQRLHKLQSSLSVRNKLRRFAEILEGEAAERNTDIDPLSFEYEDPVVAPRDSMFPRVPDPISDMLIRRKHEEVDILAYDEENLVEVLGEGRLGLPVMISINDIIEEDGLVFKSKMSYMDQEDLSQEEVTAAKLRDSCEPRGYQHFNNVNNFTSYLELSRLPEREQENAPTFGQKMASFWLCQSVVSDCLNKALLSSQQRKN